MFYAEWNHNGHSTHTMIHSLSAHFFIVLLLAIPFLNYLIDPGAPGILSWGKAVILAPPPDSTAREKAKGGGGGGGDRSTEDATRGKLPPLARIQFTPPVVKILNQNPILSADPSYLGPPEIHPPNIQALNFGLPNSSANTGRGGPGGGNGGGNGCCGGGGPDIGRGVYEGNDWGYGGKFPKAGTNGTTTPECTYCPSPVFTSEAIKAKFQGTVTLRLVVTADGRATNIIVVQGPGLGLDQAALETVRNWRFRAALGPNHKPTATWITVEVNFRQL